MPVNHHDHQQNNEPGERSVFLIEDAMNPVPAHNVFADRAREREHSLHKEATERVEQMQTDLLGTVSHELRSPLASIKGYTAMLLRHDKRLPREERREYLEAIEQATNELSLIVDRLLELAQLESDDIHLQPAPVDMRHLALESIEAIRQTRRYQQATAVQPGWFTFAVQARDAQGQPADTVPLVWADQRYLRQALDHLLENALKFSPRGGLITITLHPIAPLSAGTPGAVDLATTQPPAPSMLQIAIHDEGIGIAEAHLARIFERFQRVDTRLTREVNGLGLGLTICQRIIALHHGDLWAESQPEVGSTFVLRLPLATHSEAWQESGGKHSPTT